jgi:type VI secretion system protein ImpM
MVFKLFKKEKRDNLIYANDLVGCIGKLPVHNEFIKHGVIHPELARLDQWYQSAYHIVSQRYGNKAKTIFSQMPIYNYIYNNLPMIGTVTASHDQSGRVYPLVLFRILEHPLAHEFKTALPIMYQDYFTKACALSSSSWENQCLPDVFSEINSLNKTVTKISRRELLEVTVNLLKDFTLQDFYQNLAQQYPDLVLDKFIQAIFDAINVIKRVPIGIRFPLPTGQKINTGLIFWLQLIQSALIDQQVFMQIFWHKSALTVFFKAMEADCFSYLVDQTLVSDNLFDVVRSAINTVNISNFTRQIISQINMSLLKLLSIW